MATWEDFLREARRFRAVAEAVNGDPGFINQAVSNAILAAIAATDAVCLYFLNERPRGESHVEAARFLQRALKGTQWEEEAAPRSDQLAEILAQKSASQYHGKVLKHETASRVMKQTKRFLDWVEGILPPLPVADDDASITADGA